MKKASIALSLLLIFNLDLSAKEPPQREGRRLRVIAEEKFKNEEFFVGGTTHARYFDTPTHTLLNEEFNYITPGNDFKQSYIHPEPGKWRWDKPDQWVSYAKKHNQLIRLHAPISPQCSKWIKDDARTGKEMKPVLIDFMTRLCKRYNKEKHIRWLDVVNETVNARDGKWFGPRPGTSKWENPWTKIGYDTDPLKTPLYIKLAFEVANKHAPNMKQIINQHGSMNPKTWEKIKATVLYLRKQGLRVDGIGWQAHIDAGWEKKKGELKYLLELIDWCHEHELEFHFTEFQVSIKNKKEVSKQETTFLTIVKTALEKRKTGLVTVNFWHMRDNECLKKDTYPNLWREDYSVKPVYYSIQKLLESVE